MARESINYQLGGINNQITDEFATDNDLEVTGGGKGWTATTTRRDGTVASAKGTSKLGAAEALYDLFKNGELAGDRLVDNDDLDFEDMSEGEIAQCVAECIDSVTRYCACKCNGRNHGAGAGEARTFTATLGRKLCLCGCGGETQRQYVPGHDARHHGLIKLRAWATTNGIAGTDEELRKAKAAAARKAARERKAARKAAEAAKVAEVVAQVAAGAETEAKVKKARKGPKALSDLLNIGSPRGDDLPF